MITTILFDLDGVLVSTKKLHYDMLNLALPPPYTIEWEDHLCMYDGLKTREKLTLLTKHKGLPSNLHDEIWHQKQKLLQQHLDHIHVEPCVLETLAALKCRGYSLGCCSNSIRNTVHTILETTGMMPFFDVILSNEDVDRAKPFPDMYWKAMTLLQTTPDQVLVVEDSPTGLVAAYHSHAKVHRVSGPTDVRPHLLMESLSSTWKTAIPKWQNKRMNVLIPMAGRGSRFEAHGYSLPKPLIDVRGKPMIQVVVENLGLDAHFIFVVQKGHRNMYKLDVLLNVIAPGCTIVEADGVTEGAACTSLLARAYIDTDDPLFFANSDQYVEWNSIEFMYKMQESGCDGGITTFQASDPKWSFAEVDPDTNRVRRVAEKCPISTNATVGFYYWKHGRDFVKYADRMITNNTRVKNEFYVCPVFNEAIQDGKHITTFEIDKMWGLGTPEDLRIFCESTIKE
jgi:HAD superfamily hydrolase (TIGR01509 family)